MRTFFHRHAQISTAFPWNNSCQHFLLLLLSATDWSGRKTSRVSSKRMARVKPSQPWQNWIGKEGSAIHPKEKARVTPSLYPLRWAGECASQLSSRQHGSNRVAAECKRKRKALRALKDAARVKPSRDHELNQKVELQDSIYKGRPG